MRPPRPRWAGLGVWGSGIIQVFGFRVQGSVQGFGLRAQGSVQGCWFRVQGSVQGLGFGSYGLEVWGLGFGV